MTDISTETLLEVQYHTAGDFRKNGDKAEDVELKVGTRSSVTFTEDGYLRVEI